MTLLSVIIPARNEIYLQKTIENVLENMEGDSEIIAICDGYWPTPPIKDHEKVRIIHNTVPRGQRGSINDAAKIARGKYIMKLDGHCAVDKGFDVKLASDCEYDWTVVPRMYNLDKTTWTPKLHKRTDYMFIGWNEKDEIRSLYYCGQDWKEWHRKEELIDDTMGCMGPCFFMHKDRFWELGGCDETQGGSAGWGQQGIEIACKAWLSGGSLKVNKKTWFAHWFRGGDGGFPYDISGREIKKTRDYSKDLWLNNKWPLAKRKFSWLLEKFDPPTWEGKDTMNDVVKNFQTHFDKHMLRNKLFPNWMGHKLVKYPNDILLYQEIIFDNKPDFIIDSGTCWGGSALFFANMLDLVGKGQVITIDKYTDTGIKGPFSGGIINSDEFPKHPRITYLVGGSTSYDILAKVREMVGTGSVMVSLDSCHTRAHVKRELHHYGEIVTSGQYMVVEDTNMGEDGPMGAVNWYMSQTKKFKQMPLENRYLITLNAGGWLQKV